MGFVQFYWENLEKLLNQNFTMWEKSGSIKVLAATIPQAFIQAANMSDPQKTEKMPNFKVFKSFEWRKAEISANRAALNWQKAGKPRNLESTLLLDKKEARANLRVAVRNHYSQENVNENNEMMNANFQDPKLFSKLVTKGG